MVPVYSASDGFLTRQADWKSSLIIRVPDDPLQPGRQIWIYYTHIADQPAQHCRGVRPPLQGHEGQGRVRPVPRRSRRLIAGEGWFYIPQDFDPAKGHTIEKDAIGSGKLRDWLAKVPAEKSLIVLDACESGASDAFRGGDRERETVMAQLEYATGRNYIAAAPAGKAAYEGYKGHGVLTYAILEALHRPKDAAADPVSVFGIAAHISREVPAISQKTFGIRQQPRFTPTGDDFPLGLRTAVLKGAPPIPLAPTHTTKGSPQGLQGGRRRGRRGAATQATTHS